MNLFSSNEFSGKLNYQSDSSHLADLKSLTHDLLYETYRTEKLSRSVHTDTQYVFLAWCTDMVI